MCRVSRSTNQTGVVSSVLTKVTFDAVRYGDTSWWNVGNPTRITVPWPGVYMVGGVLEWDGQNVGERYADIFKNNTTIISELAGGNAATALGTPNNMGTSPVILAANDYIELRGYQNSSGNRSILTEPWGPDMWAVYLGPAQVPATVPSGWNVLSKGADQAVINSATLVDDNAMLAPLLASTKYRINGRIFFDTTAAGDFKYTFAFSGTTALVRGNVIVTVPGAAPAEAAILTALPSSSGVAVIGTGTTGGWAEFDFIIHVTNAGNFRWQFAQNTATNDTGAITRAGSYMEYAIA
jgi:hypothetical protein